VDYTDAWDNIPEIDKSELRRMLRQGCIGNDVAELQHALNTWNAGIKAIAEDGKFGPQTKLMVELFQDAMNLKKDGIVGPQTWKALDPYLEQKPKTIKMVLNCDVPEDGHPADELKQLIADWIVECPMHVKDWSMS
jgi:murein L,D-transpeptidase YcbB/YkuD